MIDSVAVITANNTRLETLHERGKDLIHWVRIPGLRR